MNFNRPFLIIPKFIEQPTWGGSYIAEMKGWKDHPSLQNKKIGQSYEFFSGSKLLTNITDTSDPKFVPEIGFADRDETLAENFNLKEGEDFIYLKDLGLEEKPLLIKMNQSMGNSFQLHVKPTVDDPKWQHKAESWYYLEEGLLTFGIKKGIDINEYKETCIKVDNYMHELSEKIKSGEMKLEDARMKAKEFVSENDPHKYVNLHRAKKYEIFDPSLGGIHHSWEENKDECPLGNVVFEVQEDVMDPAATIRSFDQGKIKDDGTVRDLNIDDYFKYLDTDPTHNDANLNKGNREGNRVVTTPYYCLDEISINGVEEFKTGKSYVYIFVRDGEIEVEGNGVKLRLQRGFSCFIPKSVVSYSVKSLASNTVILSAYNEK